jgi:hypothetical protein
MNANDSGDSESESGSHVDDPLGRRRVSFNKKQSVIDSVGPPKILQYKAETKKLERLAAASSPSVSDLSSEPIEDLGQFMKDFNVYIGGGHTCEFCNEITKPWPSIEAQEATTNLNDVYTL